MTAYNEDPALLAGLMLGFDIGADIRDELDFHEYEMIYADARHMREVIGRIRAQVISIVAGLRRWRDRHQELRHPLKRRYSAYEGMLIRQDLRQHWILYRCAQRDFRVLHRQCLDRMRGMAERHPQRWSKRAA